MQVSLQEQPAVRSILGLLPCRFKLGCGQRLIQEVDVLLFIAMLLKQTCTCLTRSRHVNDGQPVVPTFPFKSTQSHDMISRYSLL